MPGLIEEALAATRTRSSWNDRLAAWEKPASDSEEARIEAAATQVRKALAASNWLKNEGVQVRSQGSYHNNTNVRLQSDMDLHAYHPAVRFDMETGVTRASAYQAFNYRDYGKNFDELVAEIRQEISNCLIAAFGARSIKCGTKAFTIQELPGARSPADVTPVFALHHVFKSASGTSRLEGVWIKGSDGSQRINFPQQHHDNGISKRQRTQHRYKKVVRSMKRLRDELVLLGHAQKGAFPSFLIECLAYISPDAAYLSEEDDRYDRIRRVIRASYGRLKETTAQARLLEVNDIKLLFHPSQPWSIDQAEQFLELSFERLNRGA